MTSSLILFVTSIVVAAPSPLGDPIKQSSPIPPQRSPDVSSPRVWTTGQQETDTDIAVTKRHSYPIYRAAMQRDEPLTYFISPTWPPRDRKIGHMSVVWERSRSLCHGGGSMPGNVAGSSAGRNASLVDHVTHKDDRRGGGRASEGAQ